MRGPCRSGPMRACWAPRVKAGERIHPGAEPRAACLSGPRRRRGRSGRCAHRHARDGAAITEGTSVDIVAPWKTPQVVLVDAD